ncbi:MAG: hypothetical protein D084_Lepto4C00072G0002, partial [Leptospirillum sp. Group IV 'UBA BS']
MTGKHMDFPFRRRGLPLLSGLAVAAGLLLSSCGGGSSSSGPAPPLPNGQIGSIGLLPSYGPANCYISDIAACSSSQTVGKYAITALASATFGSGTSATNVLYWGDSGGNIYFLSNPTSTIPSISSSNSCSSGSSLSTKVLSLAVVPSSTSPELFYATSGGVYEGALSTTTLGACSSFSSTLITSSYTGSLTYTPGLVIGVTGGARYFTCSTGTSPSCSASPTPLPGLVDTSPRITAIATDPQYPTIVYVLAIGVNTGRIYAYQVGSGGTLTYLTNYSGTELNGPSGIALFEGNTATQNFCTIGPCTFMDVTNAGNTTITQYVVTYSFSGNTPNGVSINQFNNAYYNCDLVNPGPIAAIPLPGTSGTLNVP